MLGLAAWYVESRTGWDSVSGDDRIAAVARFSEEGSRIAGKPVSIRCDESRDYVGFVQHADGVAILGGDRAYLTPEICHSLYRLAFEGEVNASATGRAIAVLAHEAWHLRGEADEGATECYALQSGVELGQRLGLSDDRARQLMRQQLTENALRGGTTVEYRVPPECRDGGALDLSPESVALSVTRGGSARHSAVSPSQHPILNLQRGHWNVACRHSIAAPQRRQIST